MGQRINDLNSLPSIPLDGNFALDTTTRTGKVSASDLKDFILEDVPFKFGIDGQGNYGYIKEGADTVTPFKSEADIEEAYQDGVHSITDNPEKLTLTSTNGTDVPVTAGYYDTVNTTAVYTAGSAAGQAAADAMVNPSSASYTAGYDDGIQSITSNPQKLTLDGTNGSNVDITDGYYGTVDTTAVYNAGAASVTGDPQKLTLDGTNGTNVDIVDGYYGVVDTTAVYAAGAASVTGDPQKLVLTSTNGANVDITDGYYGTVDTRAVYNAGAASITSNPQKLTLSTTSGTNVDITDGYYGTVDTTALYNSAYEAGQAAGSITGGRNELLLVQAMATSSNNTSELRTKIYTFTGNYSQAMIVFAALDGDNNGDNFLKVYSSNKGYNAQEAPPSSAWKDTTDEWSYFQLDDIIKPTDVDTNAGVAATNSKYTNTPDYNKDVLRTLSNRYVISCVAYKNNIQAGDKAYIYASHGALIYIFGVSAPGTEEKLTLDTTVGTDVSVTPGYYGTVDNTAVYETGYDAGYAAGGGGSFTPTASSVLKATISSAATTGGAGQSYTATQRCIAIATSASFEGGLAATPTTTGTVLQSDEKLLVALLEVGQSISVNASANGAYQGATTTLAAFATS